MIGQGEIGSLQNSRQRLGERIFTLRRRRKLSQTELASRLGVTSAAISSWERGSTGPSPEHLRALGEILHYNFIDCGPLAPAFYMEHVEGNLFHVDIQAEITLEQAEEIRRTLSREEH